MAKDKGYQELEYGILRRDGSYFPTHFEQIMPAGGWYAVYRTDTEPYYTLQPLAAWALGRDEKGKSIVFGLVASDSDYLYPVTDVSNFKEYVHESEIEGAKADWTERWGSSDR